jgi:hypothetical protein
MARLINGQPAEKTESQGKSAFVTLGFHSFIKLGDRLRKRFKNEPVYLMIVRAYSRHLSA